MARGKKVPAGSVILAVWHFTKNIEAVRDNPMLFEKLLAQQRTIFARLKGRRLRENTPDVGHEGRLDEIDQFLEVIADDLAFGPNINLDED